MKKSYLGVTFAAVGALGVFVVASCGSSGSPQVPGDGGPTPESGRPGDAASVDAGSLSACLAGSTSGPWTNSCLTWASCVQHDNTTCASAMVSCFGPEWATGAMGGLCGGSQNFETCALQSGCSAAEGATCYARASCPCQSCLQTLAACAPCASDFAACNQGVLSATPTGTCDGSVGGPDSGGDATPPVDSGGDASTPDASPDASDGAATDAGVDSGVDAAPPPADCGAAPPPVSSPISASQTTTCAVNGSGAVKCWGQVLTAAPNSGPDSGPPPPPPYAQTATVVPGLTSGVAAVSVGNDFACALTTSGSVECWGENNQGVLQGVPLGSGTPVTITGLPSDIVQVSAGSDFACAVSSCGNVYCWGVNTDGDLGIDSDAGSTPTPTLVAGVTGATSVSAGVMFACALTSAGNVWCWGFGVVGQLGDNSTQFDSLVPVQVMNASATGALTGATAVSVGNDDACAIVGGGVQCWGQGGGRLGTADASVFAQPVPVQVAGLTSNVTAISVSSFLSCAVASGNAYCWGSNTQGQLGEDSTSMSSSPTPVQVVAVGADGVLTNVTAIAAGWSHACALVPSGAVCWGSDTAYQLGDNGAASPSSPLPVAVMGFP